MDILDAFLSGKPVEKKVIRGGTTDGRIADKDEIPTYVEDKVPKQTREYAEPFVKKLHEAVLRRFANTNILPDRPETSQIYQKYDFSKRMPAPRLPIENHKDEILEKIRRNTVVVLRGPTGCGKTTKVPQFILDEFKRKGLHCNIAVAQPRRIAASSNAKRVCRERYWTCGSIVGYQVGSDHRENCSEDTRILFCTTGVLVESIINCSSHNPLDRFTHIILDEVHERDKDMDFLMIAIYKHLNPKIRVILMSATIDVEKFSNYYYVPSEDFRNGRAPVIELGFERNFHVTRVFLDEIEELNFELDYDKPEISEQMYKMALKLIVFFERIDRKHAIAENIDIETYEKRPKPSVLVFLPGIYEIKQMYQRLEDWIHLNDETKILRIVMHSIADPLFNELAMQESDKNTRKIILATNIAESSITVPDVKYVIDFCLTRNLVVNKNTKCPSLQLAWASRDNCEQRAGRTGRVTNGWCFRLVSHDFYWNKMRQSARAELVTSPLENIILKTKQLNLGSPEEVLALALDKPYLRDIHHAVLKLQEMGAMLTTVRGEVRKRDGDITYIGEIMTQLPIDVKLSKLIALGYCFGVLEECIIIAAALNCSKLFFLPNKSIEVYTKKLEFADGSGSDLFALLNVFKLWKRLRKQGAFGNTANIRDRAAVRQAEKSWAEKNFLEISALRECFECVKELHVRIKRMNLVNCERTLQAWNRNEKYIVLKVVISGAFYPNYYSRSTNSKRAMEADTVKVLSGRDSSDTVYFSGFKPYDFPHMYIKTIKDILLRNKVINERDFHNITVSPDSVAEKVYVTFKNSGKENDVKEYGVACQPGLVLTEVYKAVKLSNLKMAHDIEILDNRNSARNYAYKHNLSYTKEDRYLPKPETEYWKYIYPKRLDKPENGYISHTENCGRFWFQPTKYLQNINNICRELNNPNSDLSRFQSVSEINVGQMVAAAFPSDARKIEFHRAKVIFIDLKKDVKQPQFEVRFIDFGNVLKCGLNDLRRLRGVSSKFLLEPPYCYQCSLAYIQPNPVNCPDGVWRKENNQAFVDKTDGIELVAEVFSVVNGIVRVFLYANENRTDSINKYLLDQKIAHFCEESYLSKHEHCERESGLQESVANNILTQDVIRYLQEEDIPTIPPPTQADGKTRTITIKGPISPLNIVPYELSHNCCGNLIIDPLSVNHVLLENEPNDMSEKHMVVVSANQSDKDSPLIARNTTLMPNIRLFGPLMAAIFAPKMLLVRNKLKTHYIKMVTGLGCNENNVWLSPETSLHFGLDAECKNTDIETINGIRSAINILMSRKGQKSSNIDKMRIMQQLQDDLISLLLPKRLLVPDEFHTIKGWNAYDQSEIASRHPTSRGAKMLPPHQFLYLKSPGIDHLMKLKRHHEELHQKVFSSNDTVVNRRERCKICEVDIDGLIRLHLLTRQHKDLIQAITDGIQNKN